MNNLATLQRIETAPDDWTERQRQVLDATLSLLIENAANITMIGVARRASCSKETLYKWFGDRDGLLVATVRYQASKVKVEPFDAEGMSEAKLTSILLGFATDLLTILTSEISIALNRLAIAQAHQGADSINMGSIVLQNGRFSTGPRLKPALEAGMKAGLLRRSDSEDAFRSFYGLVVRDVHIRVLLGDTMSFTENEISTEADRAVQQFFHLYGA
ncbi:TetR/AcrR family transcriptional regulator C-terminal domain-containing protein [Pararhizobium sp. IMCC21322]|uniref:TetR/AcrR family transcriptional regulator n=1 Tax=Pararhizobium sp. IMCC21322 TaxID=3067903 RepID=UPI0027410EC2|nr:TetR/AcrR family transcriptional regulator C-terminal domain-containing protein [Pararhizobium sp. IMCC21322]